jgi:hypothetical protein
MQQAVATFSNAAARTAAITSPVEGQLTYLLDLDRYEHWNGSDWISPFGMTLLSSSAISAAESISVNNVFSSSYQNYKIIYNVTGTTNAGLTIRLRNAGADATTGYVYQILQASATTITASRDTSSQVFSVGATRSSGNTFANVEISNPFASAETSYFSNCQDPSSAALIDIKAGSNSNATSYDGFTFRVASGTMTGTLRVYGVRN